MSPYVIEYVSNTGIGKNSFNLTALRKSSISSFNAFWYCWGIENICKSCWLWKFLSPTLLIFTGIMGAIMAVRGKKVYRWCCSFLLICIKICRTSSSHVWGIKSPWVRFYLHHSLPRWWWVVPSIRSSTSRRKSCLSFTWLGVEYIPEAWPEAVHGFPITQNVGFSASASDNNQSHIIHEQRIVWKANLIQKPFRHSTVWRTS